VGKLGNGQRRQMAMGSGPLASGYKQWEGDSIAHKTMKEEI